MKKHGLTLTVTPTLTLKGYESALAPNFQSRDLPVRMKNKYQENRNNR